MNEFDTACFGFLESSSKAVEIAIQNYKTQINTAEAQRVHAEQTRRSQHFRYQIEVMKHNQIMRSQ